MKNIFWRKFSKFLLLGSTAFLLLLGSKDIQLRTIMAEDGNTVYNGSEDLPNISSPNDGNTVYNGSENLPSTPSAPAAPAASSCGEFTFKYNECFACNQSRRVEQNSCGEYKTSVNPGTDSQCANFACPVAPSQGGPSCTPNGQLRTEQDCVGDKLCTFNIWKGSSCNEGRGGAYNCQNIAGRCGYNPAPPAAQAPAPAYPTAPSCPTDYKVCPNGTAVTRNPGDGCNFYACPGASAAPVTTTPVCNSSTTRENPYCLAQRYCTDDVTRDCNNNVTVRNQNCQYISGQCGYNLSSSCTPSISSISRCVKEQLCLVDLTTNSSCTHSEGSPYSCQNSASCGYTASPQTCTPSNTQDNRCVGQQMCSFNNVRNSDCTYSTTGPFSCQYLPGQCGYNQGSICTASASQQSSCVGQQMCTYNINRNSDCTMTVSSASNCQNSAQCGYTQLAVAQTFGNVGVGTSVPAPAYYYANVKQLPNTGLPALAWAAAAFIPVGFRMRRFSKNKKDMADNPNFIFEDRQFKADLDRN